MASIFTPALCQSCSSPGYLLCICDNFNNLICLPCSKTHCQTHALHHFVPYSYKAFMMNGGRIDDAKRKVAIREQAEREIKDRVDKFQKDSRDIERLIEDAEERLRRLRDRKRQEFQDISESFLAKCSILLSSFSQPPFPSAIDLPLNDLDLTPHILQSPYDINLALAPALSSFCAAKNIDFDPESRLKKVLNNDRKRLRRGEVETKGSKKAKKTGDVEGV